MYQFYKQRANTFIQKSLCCVVLFCFFSLKRCVYLKAEPTLKDKEKPCIQAQGTVFFLSAR